MSVPLFAVCLFLVFALLFLLFVCLLVVVFRSFFGMQEIFSSNCDREGGGSPAQQLQSVGGGSPAQQLQSVGGVGREPSTTATECRRSGEGAQHNSYRV